MTEHVPPRSLEDRIARLEDIQVIKNLWARYAYLADTEDDGAHIAALHTPDASWVSTGAGAFGEYHGIDAIARFFTGLYQVSPFRHHGMTNAALELADDGRIASGRWKLIDFCTMDDGPAGSGRAVLLLGDYVTRFAKQSDGGWLVERVDFTSHVFTNWERGWVVERDRAAVGDPLA